MISVVLTALAGAVAVLATALAYRRTASAAQQELAEMRARLHELSVDRAALLRGRAELADAAQLAEARRHNEIRRLEGVVTQTRAALEQAHRDLETCTDPAVARERLRRALGGG